eukprot:TRINITY_DN14707_c0_g1_i1.p1 TRINITY_DN14707_c0_g1~~TRINITY_DN14707_c0_g1_i1.p1  ORF type:complete len:438 (+),score=93.26 TRINITY_DN14707_c0_g1_i1:63-1376(+)
MERENLILRQRKQQAAGRVFEPETSSFTRAVKSLDFYPKVHSDRRKKQTVPGMVISLFVIVMISIMLVWETTSYILGTDAYHDRLSVDAGIGQKVQINLNITFPNIKCDALHLDAMDAAGEMQIDLHHDLYKSPVDHAGRLVFSGAHPYYHAPPAPPDQELDISSFFFGYNAAKDPSSEKFCGPCDIIPVANADRDRKHEQGKKVECCNTCQSVLDYYDKQGKKRPDRGDVEQCIHEESMRNPGCNIAGVLTTEKCKGNFHFAPGGTRKMGFKMLHFFSTSQALHFDIAHYIHHLSFGDKNVKRFGYKHPLDGRQVFVPRGNLAHVKYGIKAIPVVYTTHSSVGDEEAQSGVMIAGKEESAESSFEIAATLLEKVFDPRESRRPPGLSFVYDFHPMQLTHVFKRPPITHFLINLCKIVGGFFVVTGLLDRLVSKIMS